MTDSTQLTILCRDSLSLAEALADFALIVGDTSATALLYSPRRCELGVFQQGNIVGPKAQPQDLLPVFEARVFNPTAELRWLNDPSGAERHQAVILTEANCSGLLGHSWGATSQDYAGTLPQTYLLWGAGTGRPLNNGWSELATPRIGALLVPLAGVNREQHARLNALEYLTKAEHGNVIVFEERLCGLEVARD